MALHVTLRASVFRVAGARVSANSRSVVYLTNWDYCYGTEVSVTKLTKQGFHNDHENPTITCFRKWNFI